MELTHQEKYDKIKRSFPKMKHEEFHEEVMFLNWVTKESDFLKEAHPQFNRDFNENGEFDSCKLNLNKRNMSELISIEKIQVIHKQNLEIEGYINKHQKTISIDKLIDFNINVATTAILHNKDIYYLLHFMQLLLHETLKHCGNEYHLEIYKKITNIDPSNKSEIDSTYNFLLDKIKETKDFVLDPLREYVFFLDYLNGKFEKNSILGGIGEVIHQCQLCMFYYCGWEHTKESEKLNKSLFKCIYNKALTR